jgi:hypothetical protein
MEYFIRSTRKTIFIILFVIPVVFQFLGITIGIISRSFQILSILVSISTEYFTIMLLLWLLEIAIYINKKIPNNSRLIIYYCSVLYVFIYVNIFIISFNSPHKIDITILMPFHLVAMISMFYCMIKPAKLIKTYEMNVSVKFLDYIEDMLLFLVFPLGIWKIQPRINTIYNNRK